MSTNSKSKIWPIIAAIVVCVPLGYFATWGINKYLHPQKSEKVEIPPSSELSQAVTQPAPKLNKDMQDVTEQETEETTVAPSNPANVEATPEPAHNVGTAPVPQSSEHQQRAEEAPSNPANAGTAPVPQTREQQQREEEARAKREEKERQAEQRRQQQEEIKAQKAAEAKAKEEERKRQEQLKRQQEEAEKAKKAEEERKKKEQEQQRIADELKKKEAELAAAQNKLKADVQKALVSGAKTALISEGCPVVVNNNTMDYQAFRMGIITNAYSNVKVSKVDCDANGKVTRVVVSAKVN